MIEVEMNKDIRDCEQKLIGPLTKRQLLCVLIGLAYGIPIFILLGSLEIAIRIIITIICMAPAIACGWCKLYGLPLEKFIKHIFKSVFLTPTRRSNIRINQYTYAQKRVEAETATVNTKNNKTVSQPKTRIKNLPSDCRPID